MIWIVLAIIVGVSFIASPLETLVSLVLLAILGGFGYLVLMGSICVLSDPVGRSLTLLAIVIAGAIGLAIRIRGAATRA